MGVRGQLREVAAAAHLRHDLAQHGDFRRVGAAALARLGQRRLCRIVRRQHDLDAAVAFGDEALAVVPALQRLVEREDVLRAPGAAQRFLDELGLGAANLPIAQRQQRSWVALAGNDGAHDGHATGAAQRTDGVVELDVHALEGPGPRKGPFVTGHQLHTARGLADMVGAQVQIPASRAMPLMSFVSPL